jgi:hypothetical protein
MIMLYPPEGLTESVRQALRERAERGFAEAGSFWLDALPLVYTP